MKLLAILFFVLVALVLLVLLLIFLVCLVIGWVMACATEGMKKEECRMQNAVKAIIRFLLIARYGVRGGLKPPLGPRPGCKPTAWYRWRYFCWYWDNSFYSWCGIPARWMNCGNES